MTKPFDPAHAKAHGYTKEDWDAVDSPEATDDELATALPMHQAAPELAAALKTEIARRGRPPADTPKVAVSMRLDRDLLDRLKEGGRGWQTRANAMLREKLDL